MSELKVGDLVGGSLKITHCDAERLALKGPSCALLGCGFAGVAFLLLAALTWYGVVSSMGKEGAGAFFSDAGKGALVYTVGGVLGVLCLTLIESWVVDGSARTLTRVRGFGLRRSTWNASDLVEVVFSIGPSEEGGDQEPCRVLVRGKAEEPVATFGVVAARDERAPTLFTGGRRIAEMLGLPLRVDGNPTTASDALAEALRTLDADPPGS